MKPFISRVEQDNIAAAEDRAWYQIHEAYERGAIDTMDEAQQKFLEWRALNLGRTVVSDSIEY